MARKSKYGTYVQPYLEDITKWVRNGEYDRDICEKLGVSKDTFLEYKKKYSDLSDAIRRGEQNLQRDLENALYKRALGYEYFETKREVKKGDQPFKKVSRTKKHVLPDVQALIFVLCNLYPDKWKRQDQNEIANKDLNINIKIEDDDE
jgi:hypothetical protein